MNIYKYISLTGRFSRREAKRLIEAGRVTVNGEVWESGQLIQSDDEVLVDGKSLENLRELVYLAFNKPAGITTTAAKHVEGNIIEYVNYSERIFPVGRLDKETEGLILLTNDGDLANRISHSENGHEKEYTVTVDKPFTNEFIRRMSEGVQLPKAVTKPCVVEPISDCVFRITLTQGLNRQIRRMCRAFGYTVTKLERIRIMNIYLSGLQRGSYRELTVQELEELKRSLYQN
ncbi:23S rRNA pseudouridine2604 synthase [Bacillus ectoiniformans]|uniref:pseudouridine synthase n=1 Tax=Bacillus ectoiniformans TaxID=1494429 RepID=UPI0019586346|nr:pseudouridine synthase [Bacillus ectoiniformans]MBM7649873.1 23S rRNA pseudouridine2604 synthase [Bacillus ectoiniformans]